MTQRPTKPKQAPEAKATHEPDHDESMGLERMVFFSDAVFAIAITLLALDIRLPAGAGEANNSELLAQLLSLTPKYLGYIISFFVIGSFWISHHRKFRYINRYDGRLLLLNLLLLMFVAFIPFPTAVLSENGNRTATIFYALNIMCVNGIFILMWWYATYRKRLTVAHFTSDDRRRGFISSLVPATIFIVSIGIAFINEDAAKYFWLLIAPASALIH